MPKSAKECHTRLESTNDAAVLAIQGCFIVLWHDCLWRCSCLMPEPLGSECFPLCFLLRRVLLRLLCVCVPIWYALNGVH